MKLIFIRHGYPDYQTDSLTEEGRKEAELLHEYLKGKQLGDVYCSPLNRARQTCEIALGSLDNVTTKDWLREFDSRVDPNGCPELQMCYGQDVKMDGDRYELRNCWDLTPEYYFGHPDFLDREKWKDTLVVKTSETVQQYEYVTKGLDDLLAEYGYRREGLFYRTEQGNHQTLTFFCHFGITSVLLSHFMNVSPFVTLQSMVIPPTGITTVQTEEREKGYVHFRITQYGATPHLEKPSSHARFTECYEDDDRH